MLDNVFLWTLFLIFASTFLSTYLARLVRDRCLHDFEDFATTIELVDDQRFWGRLRTFASGLEVAYETPREDPRGHAETSAIFLPDRMANIQAIYRFHDELSEENKTRREEAIERAYHPTLHQQLWRALRNFVNTFQGAIGESIGFIISRAKQASSSQVVQTQDARLSQMGRTVVDTSARQAFEPILELYIGHRIVAEEIRPDKSLRRHVGILKDYTADWLELLDCRFEREFVFKLAEPQRLQLNRDIDFVLHKPDADGRALHLRIENFGQDPIRVKRLEATLPAGDGASPEPFRRELERTILPGKTADFSLARLPGELLQGVDIAALPPETALRAEQRNGFNAAATLEGKLPPVAVVIESRRWGDICLPRSRAYVKHGAGEIGRGWARQSWQELRQWSRNHRRQAALYLAGIAVSALLVGTAAGALLGWGWGNSGGAIVGGLVAGTAVVGAWLVRWSSLIRGKPRTTGRLRLLLLVLTVLAALVLLVRFAPGGDGPLSPLPPLIERHQTAPLPVE